MRINFWASDYFSWDRFWGRAINVFLVVFVAACMLWPAKLIADRQALTPMENFMFGIFIAAASVAIGWRIETKKAERRAVKQWLPKAEEAVMWLVTLSETVRRLHERRKCFCETTERKIPELAKDDSRLIRMLMDQDCDSVANELQTVRDSLDTAVEGWRSFIMANCLPDECSDIEMRIRDKRNEFLFRAEEERGPVKSASRVQNMR